jgi:DNA-binding NtrC family response regulator
MLKVKILIVDDEPDYCMIMSSYFQEKNFDVIIGSTLKEGLQLLETEKPEILFLDNHLPDGQGWTHVDEIISKYPDLRLHLISAYHHKDRGLEKKPNVTVWEKPLSMKHLDEIFATSVSNS